MKEGRAGVGRQKAAQASSSPPPSSSSLKDSRRHERLTQNLVGRGREHSFRWEGWQAGS